MILVIFSDDFSNESWYILIVYDFYQILRTSQIVLMHFMVHLI